MSRKLFSLVICLVLVLNFGVVPGSAQAEDGGEFVIRPTRIQPPDGSVDIYVPLGDNIIIRSGWGACTRGLAQAWTKQNKISLWVNGESVFSSSEESRSFWGEPESYLFPGESSCINDKNTGWRVYWDYPLGELTEGTYTIHYEENVDHPFLDGGDYDGDGKPDIDEWHISVDFNIIVTEMGSVSGTVTEEGTGEPIEGMVVDVCDYDAGWDGPCFSAWTEADGSYFISDVPVGTYRVFSGWDDSNWVVEYYNEQNNWDFADPVEIEANIDLYEIDFTLEMGGSISGHVSDANGDVAGVHVDVCAWDDSFCMGNETDENGDYIVYGLPEGNYRVSIWGGYGYWVDQFYDHVRGWDEATPVTVVAGFDTGDINFDLESGGRVSGHVSDANGDVAGVHVDVCAWDDSFCMGNETDENGDYIVYGLPEGDYRVSIWGGYGYWVDQFYDHVRGWDEATPVTVVAGFDTGEINFDLEAGGRVSGHVSDANGDVVGVHVDVCAWDDSFCMGNETDENGDYIVYGLPEGDYRVSIWGGYGYWVDQFYDHVRGWDEATPVTVVAGFDTGDINFDLESGGRVSGNVSDANGSAAYVFVDACAWDDSFCRNAETDENGDYTIYGLPEGDYRVSVWGEQGGWAEEFYNNQYSYDYADPVPVTIGSDTGGIDFFMDPAGSISGTVTAVGGGLIEDEIYLSACFEDDSFCRWAPMQPDGTYVITRLPAGKYRVNAYQWPTGDWIEEVFDNTQDWDAFTPVYVTGGQDTPNINFELQLGGSITGTVTAIGGGLIEENIDVSACFEDDSFCRWTSVQSDGTYEITGLLPGEYRVHAYQYPEGYWIGEVFDNTQDWNAYTAVSVTAGQNTPGINFTLAYGGSISGTVTAVGGGLIEENIDVSACFEDNSFCGWATVQSDGTYQIIGLLPGEYRVHAYQYPEGGYWIDEVFYETRYWDAYTPVSVTAGQDMPDINFTLELGGGITGVVEDGDGNPIEGVWVVANDYAGDYFVSWAQTDATGAYRILGLPAGTYRVFLDPQNGWAGQDYPANPVTVNPGVDTDVEDMVLISIE